jgi:hypothetical protein
MGMVYRDLIIKILNQLLLPFNIVIIDARPHPYA